MSPLGPAGLLERYPRTAHTPDAVDFQTGGGLAFVTLRRPASRNHLDDEMHDELRRIIAEIDRRADIDVAIVTGTGKAFCSGSDRDLGEIAIALHALRKPVIAAINGTVLAGGVELALACDVRIASVDAARDLGPHLVTKIVSPRRLMIEAEEMARDITRCSSGIVDRAMALWESPPVDARRALASFRRVYTDPVVVNGAPTPLGVLVDRARMLHGALADRHFEIVECHETEALATFAFRMHGTHVGTLETPIGVIEPTGRDASILGIDIFTIADGRVAAVWATADFSGVVTRAA